MQVVITNTITRQEVTWRNVNGIMHDVEGMHITRDNASNILYTSFPHYYKYRVLPDEVLAGSHLVTPSRPMVDPLPRAAQFRH